MSIKPRHLRRTLAVVVILGSLLVVVSAAYAYNGSYCYGKYLGVGKSCSSGKKTNIRRAIGHGRDYVEVTIQGGSRLNTSACYTNGCTADTGYLPTDVTGYGGIINAGDPCNCGGGDYYGWLYP